MWLFTGSSKMTMRCARMDWCGMHRVVDGVEEVGRVRKKSTFPGGLLRAMDADAAR